MVPKVSSTLSIQSFYDRKPVEHHEPPKTGDGFTEEELNKSLDPLTRKWNPEREYDELAIAELVPGPRAVTFMGRIVNLSTIIGRSTKQPKAAGWHYVVLKDDSAAISVKLYFPHRQYPLTLGLLLSIWTVFISDVSKSGKGNGIGTVLMSANIFPGRVTSDHIIIHTSDGGVDVCRTPFDYRRRKPLPGLMTLDSYLNGGYDGVLGVKILVCVKIIGARKIITKKAGGEIELAEVLLFDHTGEVKLTLWSELINSAKCWLPGKTILLISNPGYRVGFSGKGAVGFQQSTMVDVDPDFPDAEWLRKFAASLMRWEGLCLDVPEGMWDVDAALNGVLRIYFTLADVDEWVRSSPHQVFTGWINITIMDMSLVLYHRRNMLMSTECCGIPVYANTTMSTCQNCAESLTLSPNPKIIGTVVDETGCIAKGKLLWSDAAWKELFGRSVKKVTEMTSEEIRWLEQRVAFTRLHLLFGWAESVGRLAVLAVRC